jgi:hypothetical protein
LGILRLEKTKQLTEDFVRSYSSVKPILVIVASSFTCWWDQKPLRSVPHSNGIFYHDKGSKPVEIFCNNMYVVYIGYGTPLFAVIVSNDLRRRQFSEAMVI